jgi:hypothetical protein
MTETVVVTDNASSETEAATADVVVAAASAAVALAETQAAKANLDAAITVAEVETQTLENTDNIEWLTNRVRELQEAQQLTLSTAITAETTAIQAQETADQSLLEQSLEAQTTEMTADQVTLEVQTPETTIALTGSPETVTETASAIKTEASESGDASGKAPATPSAKRQKVVRWL